MIFCSECEFYKFYDEDLIAFRQLLFTDICIKDQTIINTPIKKEIKINFKSCLEKNKNNDCLDFKKSKVQDVPPVFTSRLKK
jgi:hypothetical protein